MGKSSRNRLVLWLVVAFAIAVSAGAFAFGTHRFTLATLVRPLAPDPHDLFQKNSILVLVEGLDYDYNAKDEEYSTQARSDVIKALNLDFNNHRVFEVDVPRDMDALLPNGRESKINEAQSEGGTREAQAVIAKFLGVPAFDRYVVFRINTAKDFINAIGGVDVLVQNSDPADTHTPMDYDDNWGHLHIHLKPGFQHLNGEQAVGYMRFRHDFCGDPCRIKRQQQVIHASLDKLRNNKANTLLHLGDLLSVFNRDVSTNLSSTEELSLAATFMEMPAGGYKAEQIPYVDTKLLSDGGEVIIPDVAQKERLVRTFLLAPPAPLPSAGPAALAAIDPKKVRVDVQNATGIPGVARRVANALHAKGFTIGAVGNAATSGLTVTEVHEHSATPGVGLKVRTALGSAAQKVTLVADTPDPSTSPSAAAQSDVTVVVGLDLAATHAASISP